MILKKSILSRISAIIWILRSNLFHYYILEALLAWLSQKVTFRPIQVQVVYPEVTSEPFSRGGEVSRKEKEAHKGCVTKLAGAQFHWQTLKRSYKTLFIS